ncbi:translocation/assembly module TamB domain-containing protein [Sinisalibacter aestuarii]|uniref:Translocation/assembly module TamB n=1 Tax=Sinisalibacter aestuarii TaxID=2949426 RepID=A0ABQ5LY48_9RHOB|nr:translocation/assembly module TamB domain-containing protein [Sinisalibacter aestuarii]GKY89553.1 translocation/assembly module TamB [Sinisalibacter aestuarii]
MRPLRALLLALAALIALPLLAQDSETDDKTFLENWLEKNLSAAGRDVQVTGFAGALSSHATMERLTIADDEGVWLTLTGAELDWTRSALLTGRLAIDALSADTIEISRRPVAVSDGPQAEVSDFALPELPVSINIGAISAARVVLGAPVLGVAAELSLDGAGWLDGGAGEAQMALTRIDGAEGRFTIDAAYSNNDKVLSLDLDLTEGANGIVATLTGLPGGPPLALTLAGTGPVDAFDADLTLATDGADRLAGNLTLARGTPAAGAEAASAPLGFHADLAGDPSPLFAQEYRAFFGTDVQLTVDGQREADGRLMLSGFEIATDALDLTGSAVIGANGWPERAALTGTIAAEDGAPVLLPMSGPQTRLTRAEISFDYDSATGDEWRARLALLNLARPGIGIASIALGAGGTLEPGGTGALPNLAGRAAIRASGIVADDPQGAGMLGESLAGSLNFSRSTNAPLALTDIALSGPDYGLTGALTLDTDWDKLDLIASGDVTLTAGDLARFAPATGQALTGAANLRLTGEMALPGGPFDVEIAGTAQDLGIGIAELDRLFAGASSLSLAAMRDETGTKIERLAIEAPGARAEASGLLTSEDSRIEAMLDLPDATLVADELEGALHLQGTAQQTGEVWAVELAGEAPGDAVLDFTGNIELGPDGPGTIEGEASGEIARLAVYSGLVGRGMTGGAKLSLSGSYDVPTGAFDLTGEARGRDLGFGLGTLDSLIDGASRASFALRQDAGGTLFIDTFELTTPDLAASATGTAAGGLPRIEASARLNDLAMLVPGLPGAFTANGTATLGDNGWQIGAEGTGPGGTTLRASGTLAADGARGDLALSGRAPLALANGFIAPRQLSGMAAYDLRLTGPLALASLSGTVTTEAARASLPTFRIAFDPVRATVQIAGGRATLDVTARSSTTGRVTVTGPVALSAPYPADLAIAFRNLSLTDPSLYDIRSRGQITLSGPLTGGAMIAGNVELLNVELQIPETGFGADGSLEGLQHVGEPADVRATRARAGQLGGGGGGSGGAVYGLDLTVSAPNAVFIRGRGLDAELGGSLRLGGSTANVIAEGGFSLIRGRLDLLGNRLVLKEGTASLQGNLDPNLHFLAETQAEDVTVRIALDGRASDPSVTFTSSPDLPEDEILARLVFGRGLDEISAFQALKLASAIATLSGKGGAGTIGRLREGFGLDDLDVTTDENGELAVRAGTYISDNIYTDVTVGAEGQAEINLNLTLTPNITAKGSVSSDGNTGIGIFFEKDY